MPNIVKNTTFIGLFDLLAPHSCRGCGSIGQPLCDCCKKNIISQHQNQCPICHRPNLNGKCPNCPGLPPIFVVGNRTGIIEELIHDYKYHSVRSLAKPLAEILSHTIPSPKTKVIIVPLPTISRHVRERGFDHTLLLAKHFSKLRRNHQVEPLLTRNKSTVQVGTGRKTRLTQAASAYTLRPNTIINPEATYLLLDDVWTTGASMQAATSLLQKSGAKKIIVAILALSKS